MFGPDIISTCSHTPQVELQCKNNSIIIMEYCIHLGKTSHFLCIVIYIMTL